MRRKRHHPPLSGNGKNATCFWCKRQLESVLANSTVRATRDHVVPASQGALYRVLSVWVDEDGEAVLTLHGRDRSRASAIWGTPCGYALWRFRPISDGQERIERKARHPAPSDPVPA